MKNKPTLKLVACHRGQDAQQMRKAIDSVPSMFQRIAAGPLRDCYRHRHGKAILKLRRSCVIEFVYVIRVPA